MTATRTHMDILSPVQNKHTYSRVLKMCPSYRKFCLWEPSQILRNATHFKSYCQSIPLPAECLRRQNPGNKLYTKSSLTLVRVLLQVEGHREEQDAGEKNNAVRPHVFGMWTFCPIHQHSLDLTVTQVIDPKKGFKRLHYNYMRLLKSWTLWTKEAGHCLKPCHCYCINKVPQKAHRWLHPAFGSLVPHF